MPKSKHQPRYRNLPPFLRSIREKAQLTQRDLAKKLRTSQPWVHKSEIGDRRVDITEFISWCTACGIDPDQAFRQIRSAI